MIYWLMVIMYLSGTGITCFTLTELLPHIYKEYGEDTKGVEFKVALLIIVMFWPILGLYLIAKHNLLKDLIDKHKEL